MIGYPAYGPSVDDTIDLNLSMSLSSYLNTPGSPYLGDAHDEADDATRLPVQLRYVSFAVNTSLLVYFLIISACMALLRCVHVPGTPSDTLVLFLDGSRECKFGEWQLPLVIVTTAMWAFPFVLPRLATVARLHRYASSPWNAVHRALCGMYVDECCWWEAVLLAHRLTFAALYSFVVRAPLVRAVLGAVSTVFVLAACIVYRPFRYPAIELLQVVLLSCLVVVCVVCVPSADRAQLAVTLRDQLPGGGYPLTAPENMELGLETLAAYIVPAIMLTWAVLRRSARTIFPVCR